MESVYEAAGGANGLRRLAQAWHERVLADEVVAHAFRQGFRADHIERLAAYLGEALGGPAAYTSATGSHASVVRIHSGMGEHEDMDQRAVACFAAALADVGLAGDERLASTLLDFFTWETTTVMAAYPRSADDVPDALAFPHWSWNGPER
jgi:hemoglobin